MGPIWGRQDPGGPHVGPMNPVIWDVHNESSFTGMIYWWNGVKTVTQSCAKRLQNSLDDIFLNIVEPNPGDFIEYNRS